MSLNKNLKKNISLHFEKKAKIWKKVWEEKYLNFLTNDITYVYYLEVLEMNHYTTYFKNQEYEFKEDLFHP